MSDVFDAVVGQPEAVAQLRAAAASPVHAYLLVGPPGAGSRAAAVAFTAALLCADGGDGTCRDCRLVSAGEHPDVQVFAPSGAFLSIRDDVPEIIRLAVRSPLEGARKVLVLTEFHRIREAGPALLKTIEEPPESTVFVILADSVVPELVTIASRCVRIDLPPLTADALDEHLRAEGVEPARARAAADAAGGSTDRARLLLDDQHLAARRQAWARVPERLDGSGAAVAVLVEELLELVEGAADSLKLAHKEEAAELDRRAAAYGERGSGRKVLADRQRRELRRHRADELRFGLATLAGRYRDELVTTGGAGTQAGAMVAAVDATSAAAEALVRNPNEALLLQALLLRLCPLPPARH